MESTERLVRTWMASRRDEEIDEVVSGKDTSISSRSTCEPDPALLAIASGETSLLSIVKALGEYLTSEEGELRTKGKVGMFL